MRIKSYLIGLALIIVVILLGYKYYDNNIAKNITFTLSEISLENASKENETVDWITKDELLKPGIYLVRSSKNSIWYIFFYGKGNEYKNLNLNVKGYGINASFDKATMEGSYISKSLYKLTYKGQLEDFRLFQNNSIIDFTEKILSDKF